MVAAQPHVDLSEWIEIGRIVAPQGLKGEVRVYPDTDFPERFETPGQRWILKPHSQVPEPIELVEGYYLPGKGLYVVKFLEVCDRTQSEALRDSKILVPANDRPPLEPGEFHLMDLIGLSVIVQETQTEIGKISAILNAGHDLLEVTSAPDASDPTSKPSTVLIPFVEEIVPIVDLKEQRVEIVPPAGLLDLTLTAEQSEPPKRNRKKRRKGSKNQV